MLFNWTEKFNYVKQFFLVQKDLKNGSSYKKLNISYEAVSNSSIIHNCSNNLICRKFW